MSDIQLAIGNSPGPWRGEGGSAVPYCKYTIVSENLRLFAVYHIEPFGGKTEANGRLAAAAPDLVDVLADLVEWNAGTLDSESPLWDKARALLDRLRDGGSGDGCTRGRHGRACPSCDGAKLPPFPPEPAPTGIEQDNGRWVAWCQQCDREGDARGEPGQSHGLVGWHMLVCDNGPIYLCPTCGTPPEPERSGLTRSKCVSCGRVLDARDNRDRGMCITCDAATGPTG